MTMRNTGLLSRNPEFVTPVSHKQWITLPANTHCEIEPTTLLLKFAVVEFTPDDFSHCENDYGLRRTEIESVFRKARAIRSTVWCLELFHRLIFERIVARSPESFASLFCRRELVKEALYKSREIQGPSPTGLPRPHEISPELQEILFYIEKNLHTPMSLSILCRKAAMSESALLRMFRNEMGASPMKHIWKRRLQDARLLLRTGRFRVSDVATFVGFAEVSSFSQAFSREFGEAPTARPNAF